VGPRNRSQTEESKHNLLGGPGTGEASDGITTLKKLVGGKTKGLWYQLTSITDIKGIRCYGLINRFRGQPPEFEASMGDVSGKKEPDPRRH